MPLKSWIHDVTCPRCSAPAGELCRKPRGRYEAGHVICPTHPERRTRALALAQHDQED